MFLLSSSQQSSVRSSAFTFMSTVEVSPSNFGNNLYNLNIIPVFLFCAPAISAEIHLLYCGRWLCNISYKSRQVLRIYPRLNVLIFFYFGYNLKACHQFHSPVCCGVKFKVNFMAYLTQQFVVQTFSEV